MDAWTAVGSLVTTYEGSTSVCKPARHPVPSIAFAQLFVHVLTICSQPDNIAKYVCGEVDPPFLRLHAAVSYLRMMILQLVKWLHVAGCTRLSCGTLFGRRPETIIRRPQ